MKCIIIDDEKMAREILSVFISKTPGLTLMAEFSSAIDAMKFLNNNPIDLIFLDIHMPVFSGFDFVKIVKNPPHVILVTTDTNFALEAFSHDCIADYLVKPIQEERFERAIQRVNSKNSQTIIVDKTEVHSTKEIYINIDKRLIKIDIVLIESIQAKGDYINIKTINQNYLVHTTLKKIEHKLPSSNFLKIHRSHIINIDKIVDIQDNSVLIGKDIIPVSKKNRAELMHRLNLL